MLFGGISASFFRAKKTEEFLSGKNLSDVATILSGCKILNDEVQPSTDPVLASVKFRKYLPQALFYKVHATSVTRLGDLLD